MSNATRTVLMALGLTCFIALPFIPAAFGQSAPPSGASASVVTTDTAQTITGVKTFTGGGDFYTSGASGRLNMTNDTHITMTRGTYNVSVNTVEASLYHGSGTGTSGYVGANATSLTLNGGTVSHNVGVRLNTSGGGSKPTCAAGIRGTVWYVQGAGGVADTIEICGKSAADGYAWLALATFP